MIKSVGYCHGIENLLTPLQRAHAWRSAAHAAPTISAATTYSSSTRATSQSPSSMACGMGTGRDKQNLVDYGFRLPSADGQPAAEVR